MRPVISLGGLLLSILATTPAGAGPSTTSPAGTAPAPRTATRDGWPDTRAGELGRGWVTAFNTGDKAMREFYRLHLAPEELAKRGPDERLGKYRGLRDKYGSLTFGSVNESAKAELKVTLLDADAAPHKFVFKIQPKSPYRLLSVGIMEMSHGMFHH